MDFIMAFSYTPSSNGSSPVLLPSPSGPLSPPNSPVFTFISQVIPLWSLPTLDPFSLNPPYVVPFKFYDLYSHTYKYPQAHAHT